MGQNDMKRIIRKAWLSAIALIATPVRAADAGAVLDAAMAGTQVPAMGLAVLRGGHVAALAVRGVRANTGTDPVAPDDRWHIGSDAKAMTAVLVAELVEAGRLHWDDRIGTVLPEFATTAYARATLAELLSHRAGLPHDLIDVEARGALFADDGPDDLTTKRLHYLARALSDAPVGAPGTYHYANTGYLVAAAMAERVTGESYETLLQRQVLAPLGMTHVGFGTTGAGEPQGHRGGMPTGPGDTNPPFFAPTGGFVLPLADWAAFCLDQLAGARGQGRLLSRAGYRRMQTAQGEGDYGMGWEVRPAYAGHPGPVLIHAGSDTNWFAIAVLFPRTGTGALVVANAGPDMDADAADRAVLAAIVPDL
jgi:CubicO group peptidase (beta-lactamase class C family)